MSFSTLSATWALAYIPYGGPDFGEIAAVAKAVGDGGGEAFHAGWVAAGDRAAKQAGEALQARRTTERARAFPQSQPCSTPRRFIRCLARRSIRAWSPRFAKQVEAFDNGLALSDPPIKPRAIPFEGGSMPAYFIPAEGLAGAPPAHHHLHQRL